MLGIRDEDQLSISYYIRISHHTRECDAALKGILRWSHLQDSLLIEKKQDVDVICFFLPKKEERSILEYLLVF